MSSIRMNYGMLRLWTLPLVLLGSALLSGCFDDDDGSSDTAAPTAEVHFPGYVGLTDGDTVLVTGASSDASEITRVRVAGVDATSTDGFATWRAVVPLEPGDNELTVETTDEFSNIDSAAAALTVRTTGNYLQDASGIVLDAANNRALVVDMELRAVIAVDLATGVRTILSDSLIPDSNNPFQSPVGIAVDSTNDRALVVDSSLGAVLAVDLATGARSILSPNDTLQFPVGIAVDTANNRALVINSNNLTCCVHEPEIIAVDLDTGAHTVLSSNTIPDTNIPLGIPVSIAVDEAGNRALVTSISDIRRRIPAVIAVDLTTGVRNVLSDFTTPDASNPLLSPGVITLDADNGRALVVDGYTLKAINLTNGARSTLAENTIYNTVNFLTYPRGIALDAPNGRALLVGSELDGVMAVDLATGARSILSDSTTLDSSNPFEYPEGIALDTGHDRVLVTDRGVQSLVAMDLRDGSRTILSSPPVEPGGSLSLMREVGIAVDRADRVLVVDTAVAAVNAVDTATGERTVLSSNMIPPNPTIPFNPLGAIVLDADNARALVANGSWPWTELLAVDLNTGERSVLSGYEVPDTNNQFSGFISGLALDSARGRVLVVDDDGWSPTILTVSLATGARSILSNSTTPDEINQFVFPGAIALDTTVDRALVVDNGAKIVALNLDTGARRIVSGSGIPDENNTLSDASGIVVDAPNGRALVIDRDLNAVVAVELTTGERVIVSK